jgi:hypothetical protein
MDPGISPSEPGALCPYMRPFDVLIVFWLFGAWCFISFASHGQNAQWQSHLSPETWQGDLDKNELDPA